MRHAPILLVAFLAAGCGKSEPHGTPIASDPTPPRQAPAAATSSPPVAPPRPLSIGEQLRKTQLLPDALRLTVPLMKDTVNDPDPGSTLLAVWMSDNPSWSAIERLPETTHSRVLKDSEVERGKRICARGTVLQIAKEQGTKIYSGTFQGDDAKTYFYLATASTGDLLDGHRARFCGVVTSRFSYENVNGGSTHAVRMVGIFDLPENRKL